MVVLNAAFKLTAHDADNVKSKIWSVDRNRTLYNSVNEII